MTPDIPPLADFARALARRADFAAVARDTLHRLLALTAAAIADPALGRARIRRALLHLRPARGYAGLWVLEADADALSDPDPRSALLPSASVWRRLEATGAPVAVDVNLRTMQSLDGDVEQGQWIDEERLSDRSRARLLERDATHACALPLTAPGGLAGMVSIEVGCRAAIGRPFIWARCRADFDATLAVAGPYLTALRPADPAPAADALLPVIGPTMAPLVRVLRAFAAEEETLLIRGETGTGKSRLARYCHARSPRKDGPFEVLDLLSVPADTQVGELFGWRRGAFTGAVRDHDGYVARAEGGTLFIDEIDKLSLEAQAALLHLLEERRYRVLGAGGRRLDADVRFIVGTNADLAEAVAAGRFREDLYYRINVLPLELPPLRARPDEITDWARYMLRRCHESRSGAGDATLADAAAALLCDRPWPGNLRQLDNIIRRAYTLAGLDADPAAPGRHVDAAHVRAADALERGRAERSDPIQTLLDAAAALAARLAAAPAALADIEWPGALHGLLLAAAVFETGSRDEAFRLLGYDSMVANRNHHKAFHRDMSRLEALAERLGVPLPATLRALSE
ncbi:MAG: sigma 54-interacting transcriptional regulator [bacterium]